MALIDLIADERERVADFAAQLSTDDLAAQSLCEAWTVRDVLGHLLMPLVTPMPRVVLAMARHRFDFNKASIGLSRRVGERPLDDLVAGLREHARDEFTPPGLPLDAPPTDLLVHGQDMARPIGRELDPPVGSVLIGLDFITGPKGVKAFPVADLQGYRMVATDGDWARGDGPEISGRALDLLLCLTGRSEPLSELAGRGVAVLAQRLDGA
ncbi:MAG: maleylpyruvate isomerase family mycothiol-dependent enzyme [Gordonia sp. (in: high G+C Gram-positive bacteria)]